MYSIQLDEELSGGGIINHVSGMRFIQAGQHTQLALSLTIKFLSSGFKLSFKAAAIALSLVRKKVIHTVISVGQRSGSAISKMSCLSYENNVTSTKI